MTAINDGDKGGASGDKDGGGLGLSTSQHLPYNVEDVIRTHNPCNTVFGDSELLTKAISEKKKIVRSKSYEPHALGTNSFARLADEEKTGVLPTRGTLYIMSRTKKNGSIVNATVAKVIKEKLNDASTSTSNTTNDASTSTSNTTTGC
nr:hypothetical protein [Tanacetum cinerariifolium]